MTYFLSDPIPALCDEDFAYYSSALQNHGQEAKTSQVGCYWHVTEEMEIQVMGGKITARHIYI